MEFGSNRETSHRSAEASPFVRRDLSTYVILGLLTGVACGLFFGEYCAVLSVVGEAFVNLLRMTVLPYIAVSLVSNIGKLSLTESRRLAVTGGAVLLLLWSAAMVAVVVLPFGFPEWKAGSFFSTTISDPPVKTDVLSMFIPSNIFAAFIRNDVPAIVLVCIALGLALSTLNRTNRQQLISTLDIFSRVLIRVSIFVSHLSPIGIFAITANATGTMSFEDLFRLKAYLLAYTIGAILLAFLVLPLMVRILTPWRYRDVMAVARDPMITAFATGKLIIVLPLLMQRTEQLFAKNMEAYGTTNSSSSPDVLYPLAYAFPHIGKLLGILFIPFSAWFMGNALSLHEYPGLIASGIPAYFAGPIIATPWLLDYAHLPHDMFQLFLLSGVYCERLGDALGVMHLTAFTLLTASAVKRRLKYPLVSLLKAFVAINVTAAIALAAMSFLLQQSLKPEDGRTHVLSQMQLIEHPVASIIEPISGPNPAPLEPNETLLQRIRRRGVIRIGFNENELPFAFFNADHQLVGFDINMAHALAADLGVSIEFVKFSRNNLTQQINNDNFDVAMSGLVGTLERAENMVHTSPYLDVSMGFVVHDYRIRSFKTFRSMRELQTLRIGFVDHSRDFIKRIEARLPNAEFVEIPNNKDFFQPEATNTKRDLDLDALLISAESGSAYTIQYPDYQVVVPDRKTISLPLFYAIANSDVEMRDFLEHWIRLRKDDGTLDEYYNHWILGQNPTDAKPRWSVIRDVLHWMR